MHFTVLKKESVASLFVKDGGIYVDATFGGGGHSEEILNQNKNITLVCIDRDKSTEEYFEILKRKFPNQQLYFAHSKFSNIDVVLKNLTIDTIDGIIFDFGLSSMQIDNAYRGFSFQTEAPLSMEMGLNNISAYDVVNEMNENDLANILFQYGGEKKSRKIAKNIVQSRPITTTTQLANIIKSSVGFYNDTINPATRTFQAIRILVNNELEEIEKALHKISEFIDQMLYCSCISFHSLEDAIVKKFIKQNSISNGKNTFDKNYNNKPIIEERSKNNFFYTEEISRGIILPTEEEIKLNSRSRSAKLRSIKIMRK